MLKSNKTEYNIETVLKPFGIKTRDEYGRLKRWEVIEGEVDAIWANLTEKDKSDILEAFTKSAREFLYWVDEQSTTKLKVE